MRPLLTRIIPAAVLAAIIAAGGAAVAGAGGGDSTAPADEVSSPAPIPTGSNGQEPTHLEALASHGDQVGVVDSNGDKVGFMDAADLLYSDLTIVREMRAYGIEDTRTLADDVASAFTTLAALPVTNERGGTGRLLRQQVYPPRPMGRSKGRGREADRHAPTP